jgi:hypothetical protein
MPLMRYALRYADSQRYRAADAAAADAARLKDAFRLRFSAADAAASAGITAMLIIAPLPASADADAARLFASRLIFA